MFVPGDNAICPGGLERRLTGSEMGEGDRRETIRITYKPLGCFAVPQIEIFQLLVTRFKYLFCFPS